MITGTPPLHIVYKVIGIKHYLKAITVNSGSDFYVEFISSEISNGNTEVMRDVRQVFQFLDWKMECKPQEFTVEDKRIISNKDVTSFKRLSECACFYTKTQMTQFTEYLWQISISNQLQIMGETRIPTVTCTRIPLPEEVTRETEVKLLSLFYKQNLLNLFLSTVQKGQCKSALCECGDDIQDSFHVLTSCELVSSELRDLICTEMTQSNNAYSMDCVPADYISILNSSRNQKFIESCIAVIVKNTPKFRAKFTISNVG